MSDTSNSPNSKQATKSIIEAVCDGKWTPQKKALMMVGLSALINEACGVTERTDCTSHLSKLLSNSIEQNGG